MGWLCILCNSSLTLQHEKWKVVAGRGTDTRLVSGPCLAWWARWQSRLVLRGANSPVGGREAGVNRLTALQHSDEDGRQVNGGL